MTGPSGELFVPPPGWERSLREGEGFARRILEEIRLRIAGLLGDPALILTVSPENREDLRAAAGALEAFGRSLEAFGAAALAAARSALGDGWLAARGYGMDPAAAWSRWLQVRAGDPMEALAGIFREAGRFMASILARNGYPAEPLPPPALPSFVLTLPPAPPAGDRLEIRPEDLRAAIGSMERALAEASGALTRLQEALARLETWEGYARLGFRDGVEPGRRALASSLADAARILSRIRRLPAEADRVAMALSAIAPIPPGALRLRLGGFPEALQLTEVLRRNALDLEETLARQAAALREAWEDAAGAEAALRLEGHAALARETVAREAEALQARVRAVEQAVNAYLAAVRVLTDPEA